MTSNLLKKIPKKFQAHDKIYCQSKLTKEIILKITKKFTVNFVKKEKANKIVSEKTMDDLINDFLKTLFYENIKNRKKTNEIFIFKKITDKELKEYAKKHNLNFKPKKKNPEITKFIKKIEKNHPEIKYSLIKSIENL